MHSILDFDFHDKIFNRMVACRKRSKPRRWSGADRDRSCEAVSSRFCSGRDARLPARCSRSTIDAYVRAGLLPKPETIGNLQRWDFVEVRAFIKAQNAILSEDVASEEDAFFKGLESGSPKKGKR
jgi:hypothetical protein